MKARTSTKEIHAKISQKGLSQIADFFNQNPETTLAEILQNARRANSTQVEITAIEVKGGVRMTIVDNGDGIKDERTLMSLWESGWDEAKKADENPAGFGFFSLSHLPNGVIVRSQDWEMHVAQHVFSGGGPAMSKPLGKFLTGTELVFHLPNITLAMVDMHIRQVCRYYPVPVRYNKQNMEQADFFEDAIYVGIYEGLRIGIFQRNPTYKEANINFHGVTLHEEIPCPHPEWMAKIDVLNARMLDLVKPTRNHVILNQKWEDAKALVRTATYEGAAAIKKHRLPFKAWLEAKSLGIKIPEADARLKLATPSKCHDDMGCTWPHNPAPNYDVGYADEKIPRPKAHDIVSHLANEEVVALHFSQGPIPLLFESNPEMEGYSWYPKRQATEITQKIKIGKRVVVTTPDGKGWEKIERHLSKANTVDEIELELKITQAGENPTFEKFTTDIAFNIEESGDLGVNNCWITTKEGLEKTCFTQLNTLFFSPGTDAECDSYETQEEYFEEQAQIEIIERAEGADAAHIYNLQKTINCWDVENAMESLGVKTLTISRDRKGKIKIELGKKTPKRK